ncbi:MAG: UDP-N-acetylmuramate dehydrogenase [Clostridia bacterium]|nr:UDP-N-acetylmuramate dehydrogenase [Clostridia bacterium]
MRRLENAVKSVKSEPNFDFSKHTTYGLGGRAKTAYFPQNEDEAVAVYKYLKISGEKFVILGKGSNLLVSDKYYDGSVICTKYLQGIEIEGNCLKILSGTTVQQLLSFCVKNGITGFEYLAAIPASIGGLTVMNGGTSDRRIASNILTVKVFDGKMREFSNKNCNFGNKHSTMSDINALVLAVYAGFEREKPEIVETNINYYLNKRKLQPKGKSCGCVFKNPEGFSAGKIIDDLGLKGMRIGGAEVSREHANFIINNGGSSADVYALIKAVKKTVYETTGINLEEEVIYIGEFNDELNC